MGFRPVDPADLSRMKTYSPKPQHIERRWYVVDAQGQTLGRMASEVAALLRGKHKPIFAPHMDTGDHVIVVNAGGIVLTGGKENKKVAYRHSGYPGGIKATGYATLMSERPVFVVEKAVKGMLPKNRLGRAMFKKLHVMEGAEHPHRAQQPVAYTLGRPPTWEGLPGSAPIRATGSAEVSKAPAGKPPAKKASTAAPVAKPAAKKPTARKPAAKKPTAKKTSAKKPAAKRPVATKAAPKKPSAKKTPSKKTVAKQPAKKTAATRSARGRAAAPAKTEGK
jgi:large subunit ribosomal protein L13